MIDLLVALLIAACVFLAATAGLRLRMALPQHHLSSDARDGIVRGAGTISLLASLVLGLLLSTAKGTLDNTDRQIQGYAADLVQLDDALRNYGDAAAGLRALVADVAARTLQDIRPKKGVPFVGAIDDAIATDLRQVLDAALRLTAAEPGQEWLRRVILDTTASLTRQRVLLAEQAGPSVRPVFLVILVFWISALFFFFGLNTPLNASVMLSFAVCALIVGSAFFLVMEMDSPLEGMLRISPGPIERALQTIR